MSRPFPQTSIGKLVSLSVDNAKYYTSQPPPLFPCSSSSVVAGRGNNEEQTILWSNIATLFAKCDQQEEELQKQKEAYERLTRGTDDIYQELQDTKIDIHRENNDENNKLSTHVRKLRKYVNKKCDAVRETVSALACHADDDIFAYIDTLRLEFQSKTAKMEDEIAGLNAKLEETNQIYDSNYEVFVKHENDLMAKLEETNQIYDSDYQLFVKRENDLMAKLEDAVQTTANLTRRVKDVEHTLMAQIQESRVYAEQHQYQTSGDLREEFTRAICREIEFESTVSAKLVQSVNDELFELITRSNEYHTARHFGMMEDVKESREMCKTLKQSIGMVDAELSDVKETVEFLKDEVGQASNDLYEMKEEIAELNDDVYREMDRDYYDLKDYVKHRVHRHNKQKHACADTTAAAADTTDPIQMIVTEYADADADDTDADDTDADDTDAVADAEAAAVFVKPTLISNEMASFLGKPEGSVLFRTEVTREVLAYIRDHKLQDKDNGRKINPDDNLFKLLKLNKGDELTYFSLQSYMAVHFTKFSADTNTADTTAEDEGVVIIMDNLFSAEDDE